MTPPIRVSFEVACPAGHGFDTWTRRTSSWWPVTHTVTEQPGVEVIFEARRGGRIFDRAPDGREVEWGEVTAWEPPHRLCYLWHIRDRREDATEVEIRFVAAGAARTRIDIEHRGGERLGARGPGWRDANLGGWNGVLSHFATACSAG